MMSYSEFILVAYHISGRLSVHPSILVRFNLTQHYHMVGNIKAGTPPFVAA